VSSDAGPRKGQLVASHDANDCTIRRSRRDREVRRFFEGGCEANAVVCLEGNGFAGALLPSCTCVVFVAVAGHAVAVAFNAVAVAFVRGVLFTGVDVTVGCNNVAVAFVRNVLVIIARGVLGACDGRLWCMANGVPLIGGSATHGIVSNRSCSTDILY